MTEHFVYDEMWRLIAVYRQQPETDLDESRLYERYVWHAPGRGGFAGNVRPFGGIGYLDSLILRDRDADLDEEEEPILEERLWYHQNWRGDVELILKDPGAHWLSLPSLGRSRGLELLTGQLSAHVDDAHALPSRMTGDVLDLRFCSGIQRIRPCNGPRDGA